MHAGARPGSNGPCPVCQGGKDLKKILWFLDNYLEEIFLACAMAYFLFATTAQVVTRFVLQTSAPWTEESARYVFIWMTFIGAAYAAKKGIHIRIDLLDTYLPPKAGRVFRMISTLLFLVFMAIMVWAGWQVCSNLLARPQYSPVMRIPTIIVYAAVPVGCALTCFRIVQSAWRDIRSGKKEGESK